MMCQLCCQSQATRVVPDPTARDGSACYCEACYQARHGETPSPPGELPRLRFQIRDYAKVVTEFAVVNAIVAWSLRSGIFPLTPAQVATWTVPAFVAVNVFAIWHTLMVVSDRWFRRLIWHRRTGGVLPYRGPARQTIRQQALQVLFLMPLFAWFFVASLIERWVVQNVWHRAGGSPPLFAILVFGPLVILLVSLILRRPELRDGIRRRWLERRTEWQTASTPERAWRILWVLVPAGLFVLLILQPGRLVYLMFNLWPGNPAVSFCLFLLIGLLAGLFLRGGLAITIRRR